MLGFCVVISRSDIIVRIWLAGEPLYAKSYNTREIWTSFIRNKIYTKFVILEIQSSLYSILII